MHKNKEQPFVTLSQFWSQSEAKQASTVSFINCFNAKLMKTKSCQHILHKYQRHNNNSAPFR